jgi:hypothetical protein
MINPTDCRELAAQCIELANNSGNGGFRSMLFNMAHKWTDIAEFREECFLVLCPQRASKSNAFGCFDVINFA